MNSTNPYYIAETAFHHEGSSQFLKDLIYELKDVEINAIKLHLLFDLNDYIIPTHPANEILDRISIKIEEWESVFQLIKSVGKEIVVLCNDVKSLQFVNQVQGKYPISAIELHSTGLNDIYLLEESLNFEKTIILGIGGSTFDEIQYAVDFLNSKGKFDIILMHGFQNYPTNYEDINFKRINLIKNAFDLPIGYADHTDPNDEKNIFISTLPIMLGVNVIEKHVTNKFGENRIDAQAAVSIDTMKKIVELGNSIFETIGSKTVRFSEEELNYGNTGPMKKALVARKEIKSGETITKECIAFKRTLDSSPLQQKDYNKILGSIAVKDIGENEIFNFSNVKYEFKKASFDQFFIKK
jgi:sialic acid synthase SpsE